VRVYDSFLTSLRDGSSAHFPRGSKLRIEDDTQRSSYGGMTSPKAAQFGDGRGVRVTLLDGQWAGESITAPRYMLKADR